MTSTAWANANPAKVHAEVLAELNKPVTAPVSAEITQAEQQARKALQLATDVQKASDPALKRCAPIHADTALEWAQLRNELAQLAKLQVQVHATQKRVAEAAAALKREQAYLEETEARRGRALAALQQLEAARQPKASTPVPPNPQPQSGTQPTSKGLQ